MHSLDPARLRARGTLKWTTYPPDVLPMWVAEMDYPTCPEVLAGVRAAAEAETFGYPARPAMTGLAEDFAAWSLRVHGQSIDPAGVHIVGDVMHGVSLAIRYFSGPTDPVVIPAPVYSPFFDVVGLSGRPQIPVPMIWDGTRHTLDIAGIEAALAAGARTVLLCNPHNPLGRVFDSGELTALADVVAGHGARVVADEIHAGLALTREHRPYAAATPLAAGHTITVTSASKTWNLAGLKCAQVITHTPADTERWRAIPFWETVGVSTIGIAAGSAAYRLGEPWRAELLGTLREHAALVAEAVAGWPGVQTVPNEGTYLQWLDCTGLELDEEPADWLLREAKVALTGAVPFGGAPHRFARLNFATTRTLLDEGLSRIAAAIGARMG